MKRLSVVLFGMILFASEVCAQMIVFGNMLNVGDFKVHGDLVVNAEHNGTSALRVGLIDNRATGANGVLMIDNNLILHTVKWNTSHAKKNLGADAILRSNPAATSVPTVTTGAQVVMKLNAKGYYYFSLPFDVAEGGISNTAGTKYYLGDNNKIPKDGYWIRYYDTEKRARLGLLNGSDYMTDGTSSGWVAFGSAESVASKAYEKDYGKIEGLSPHLRAGQTYCIWVDKLGDYTFTAASTTKMFDKDAETYPLAYTSQNWHPGHPERVEYNFGWNGIGTMQTAPFRMTNGTNSTIEGALGNNIYAFKDGVWTPYLIGSDETSIAPYAGLMVQLPATVGVQNTITATFKGVGRQITAENKHLRSAEADQVSQLRLQIYNTDASDLANANDLRIFVRPGASNEFRGGEDGLKFYSGATCKTPEFGALIYNGETTIPVTNDFRATFANNEEIPISLWIKESGNYTIQLKKIEGFDLPLYLIDKVGNTVTELTPEVSYEFQASATAEPIDDRFALRAGGTSDLPSIFNKTVIYCTDNSVYVKHLTIGDNVAIYNLTGQLITSQVANAAELSCRLPSAGVYVVKVTGAESVVAKVINK